ncbi:hypothetical protein HB770_06105 [Rhizobium leguminosarum bv. viciae]|uniref:DNA ligase (ATP) n=1 Tax=Rhizobium leguminosarum bv. viciae TaxID=387 RepID=A0A7G6RIB9_RHILV|nr:hypothetical protein HB770_06105 [Rhizobium leguminosarum bv. viciae]
MRETATGRLQYHHRIIQVASGRPRSGSLLLAARRGNHLIYVGSVGTGLKESDAWRLRAMMDKLLTKKPPLAYEGLGGNMLSGSSQELRFATDARLNNSRQT